MWFPRRAFCRARCCVDARWLPGVKRRLPHLSSRVSAHTPADRSMYYRLRCDGLSQPICISAAVTGQ